jgi:hypothetical protein
MPFNPETSTAGLNMVSLGNDAYSAALPIGFSFEYFGTAYTSFTISSNGFITFSAQQDSGCCFYELPCNFEPSNLIAMGWTDLDPSQGGQISYVTRGAAPNRRLLVTFVDVPIVAAGAPTVGTVIVQAILREGTNEIEVHTVQQQGVTQFTRGIEGPATGGPIGAFLPGEVVSQLNLSQTAVRFTTGATPDGVGDACSNTTKVLGPSCFIIL